MKIIVVVLLVAALAGCVNEDPGESGNLPAGSNSSGSSPNGFPPNGALLENSTEDLSFVGIFTRCPEGFCLNLTATNEGSQTYHVETGCSIPFKEFMEEQGRPVQHREPHATCAGFGTTEFGAGETMELQFTWDGRLWEGDEWYDASGTLGWHAEFIAYTEPLGSGERIQLSLEFPVMAGSV